MSDLSEKDMPKAFVIVFLGGYVAVGILSVYAAVYLFPFGLVVMSLGFLAIALSISLNVLDARELAEERD